jgi:nicotinamide phosphoribosyltransferase
MKIKPHLTFDGYKCDHRRQYPDNSLLVFSNMTARGSRVKGLDKVFFFGLQAFIKKHLLLEWNEEFFHKDVEEVVASYNRRLTNYLGPNAIGEQHIRDLHALGYLPLEIWALPEGSNVNLRVPMFVMWNTDDRFFWLTNAIETIISASIWGPCTSTTTAVMYRKILNEWANKTNPEMIDFVPWQGHDFSFRGHFGQEAAVMSAAGHLLAFTGTDTVPAIDWLEEYYNADSDKELVGGSVAASEHSVACLGSTYDENGNADDYAYFERMITQVYPTGIVSLVSDTFDFWGVVDPDGGTLVRLKDVIMARDGKVVIRPDSGDPVKIVTGYTKDEIIQDDDGRIFEKFNRTGREWRKGEWFDYGRELSNNEVKGLIQCLWEIFGGTTTSKGYKQLDSHIGAIYGDSITLERATQICERLEAKGFASTNLVYGIGSFTYQGAVTADAIITRDTHGFAVKSTYGEVLVDDERKGIEIFKDPKTDDGLKKSAKGLIAVYEDENGFLMKDQATWDDVKHCAFVNVFSDGKIIKEWTLAEIRSKVSQNF